MKSDWDMLVDYVSGATPAERRPRVERWIREDPARERMLADLQALWSARLPTVDAEVGWRNVLAGLEEARPAADAEAIAASRPPLAVVPGGGRLGVRPRTWPSWLLRAAVIAGVVLGGGLMARGLMKPTSAEDVWASAKTFSTERGQVVRVDLPDGTAVTLGAQSRLLVPTDYGTRTREVRLAGQGFFGVTHDAERPFTVLTAAGSARVLGTEFVVTAWQDAATQVVVAEGRVAVRSTTAAEGDATVLTAGRRAQIAADRPRVEVDIVDPLKYLAWMEGRLVFENVSMAVILEEVERWYDVELRVEDAELASRTLNATFDRPSLSELLHGLSLAADATYSVDGRTVTFVPRP